MTITDELQSAMLESYRRAFQETGYRAARFKQAVDRSGGLATAKRMLKPRTKPQRAGLDSLIAAGKPELSLEYIVLQPRFASLFTAEELRTAQARLDEFVVKVTAARKIRDNFYPDDLEPGRTYNDGAKKQVRVNAYERDPRARAACILHHGPRCAVCGFDFERRYGEVGRGFIHVHHLRPLAEHGEAQTVDPRQDLAPVCPNCHAMLHRGTVVRSIDELRQLLVAVC